MEVSEEDKELLDRVASAPVVKMVNSMVPSAYKVMPGTYILTQKITSPEFDFESMVNYKI